MLSVLMGSVLRERVRGIGMPGGSASDGRAPPRSTADVGRGAPANSRPGAHRAGTQTEDRGLEAPDRVVHGFSGPHPRFAEKEEKADTAYEGMKNFFKVPGSRIPGSDRRLRRGSLDASRDGDVIRPRSHSVEPHAAG